MLCIMCVLSLDYSEERVAALLNADLADTLGNLLQRVTAKKLHPTSAMDQRESTSVAQQQQQQLESEWSKMSKNDEDRAFVDHLRHLTGGRDCMYQLLTIHYHSFEFSQRLLVKVTRSTSLIKGFRKSCVVSMK